jgi:O-antigen/teichoic acid export membrane protein
MAHSGSTAAPPPRRRMMRDIAGVFSARAMWAVLGTISGVILARQLGPHDRGILAIVLLVPSTVITISKLGIAQSIVYAINREKAPVATVASNVITLAFILSAISIAAVWFLRETLLSTVLRTVPTWALAFALARVPMLLLDNYLYGVLQATGRFSLYNRRLVSNEILRLVLVAITVGVLDLGLPAAVILYTFANATVIISLLVAMRREIPFTIAFDWPVLKSQLSFGLKSWVQTVAAHLLLRIDIYMVSYFLDPAQTAFYALALHFTEIVLEFPQAIGLVLFPRLASLPKDEVHRLTAQTARRTLMVTIPSALALAYLGPWVIVAWYGKPYAPAGAPLAWAGVGVVMMSLYVILTRDFTSRGRQQINIVAGLLALITNVVLNCYTIPTWGIVGAAVATAVSYTLACLTLLAAYVVESRLSPLQVLFPTREDIGFFWDTAQRGLVSGMRGVREAMAKAGL